MKNSTTIPVTNSGNKNKGIMKLYNNLLNEFKREQTGYSAIAIIGQSCLGSAAVMLLLMQEMSMAVKMSLVFFVTIFCMAYNAAVLAQLKSKITFNLLILSIVFSCIVILATLF